MQLPAFLEKISWYQIVAPAMTHFRKRRLTTLIETYPDIASYRVLDVGGRPDIWRLLNQHYGIAPKELVLLNVAEEIDFVESDDGSISYASDDSQTPYRLVIGNGCDLPFDDQSFDLAFSNSVIEHVGDSSQMQKFAQECVRVGQQIYVQTPNHWFPMEPHFVTLFIHWLPRSLYRRISFLSLHYLMFAWRSESLKQIFYREFDSIRLLRRSQLQRLFPNSQVNRERVLGLTKSFIVTG
jgi:ubiquinone/menaquinone biosynthesis C-methylase UbiE